MRFESLKNIKLKIKIPGNLDLYAGHGINIVIPATTRSGSKTQIDKKYSGRYMIASLTHRFYRNYPRDGTIPGWKDSIPSSEININVSVVYKYGIHRTTYREG